MLEIGKPRPGLGHFLHNYSSSLKQQVPTIPRTASPHENIHAFPPETQHASSQPLHIAGDCCDENHGPGRKPDSSPFSLSDLSLAASSLLGIEKDGESYYGSFLLMAQSGQEGT